MQQQFGNWGKVRRQQSLKLIFNKLRPNDANNREIANFFFQGKCPLM